MNFQMDLLATFLGSQGALKPEPLLLEVAIVNVSSYKALGDFHQGIQPAPESTGVLKNNTLKHSHLHVLVWAVYWTWTFSRLALIGLDDHTVILSKYGLKPHIPLLWRGVNSTCRLLTLTRLYKRMYGDKSPALPEVARAEKLSMLGRLKYKVTDSPFKL